MILQIYTNFSNYTQAIKFIVHKDRLHALTDIKTLVPIISRDTIHHIRKKFVFLRQIHIKFSNHTQMNKCRDAIIASDEKYRGKINS